MPTKSHRDSTPSRPRVNLRFEREQRRLTVQDIQIRTGISLEHIEALETGIVPESLRGRKLLKSKHRYLHFFGFSRNSKLEVKRRRRKRVYSEDGTQILTGSTEIVVPTTSRSILTGFGLAIGLVIGLKGISLALDNEQFSIDGFVETSMDMIHPNTSTDNQPQEILLVSAGTEMAKTNNDSIDDSVNDLVHSLLAITDEKTENDPTDPEPLKPEEEEEEVVEGPQGPHSIRIKILERTSLTLKCDGYVVFMGKVDGGEYQSCNYSDKSMVYLSDITDATVHQNDKLIKPMGPQGSARRLTFLND